MDMIKIRQGLDWRVLSVLAPFYSGGNQGLAQGKIPRGPTAQKSQETDFPTQARLNSKQTVPIFSAFQSLPLCLG